MKFPHRKVGVAKKKSMSHWFSSRFSFDAHPSQKILYMMMIILVVANSLVAVGEALYDTCNMYRHTHQSNADDGIVYKNPEYSTQGHCIKTRFWFLLGLTPIECMLCRRCLWSLTLGCLIGFERRRPDRPAGIRTMSVVALGSCIFTLDSMYAFSSSPDSWDSSRVAAAIPSGVGFLGAGIIYKQPPKNDDDIHSVHGITTAGSIWFSAAIGIASGGGLYIISLFATMTIILILRFGPHLPGEQNGSFRSSSLNSSSEDFVFQPKKPHHTRSSLSPSHSFQGTLDLAQDTLETGTFYHSIMSHEAAPLQPQTTYDAIPPSAASNHSTSSATTVTRNKDLRSPNRRQASLRY